MLGFCKLIYQQHVYVYVSVCSPQRLIITCVVIWNLHDWLNMFYSFCMLAEVIIGIEHGYRIEAHQGNLQSKSKLVLYKPLIHCNSC